MISNPAASPLFGPTLLIAGGLLGGSLLLLLALGRSGSGRDVLMRRWRVWAAIAPAYVGAVLGGALPLLALVGALVSQGLREYSALVGLPRPYRRVLLALGLAAPLTAFASPDALGALPPVLLMLATLQPLLLRPRGEAARAGAAGVSGPVAIAADAPPARETAPTSGGVRHLAFAALGWGYVAWFLSHLVLLHRHVAGGPGVLLALGLAVCLSDVGAFAAGKRWGRRKLAPSLSPNKTWAGAGGNVVGAYAGVALMGWALPGQLRWQLLALLPPVVAVGALWGDLLESAIKREFGAKDAGAWLPGFGGLLDRIDSLIVVAPLAYYLLRLLG